MDASSSFHAACDVVWPPDSMENAIKHAAANILFEQKPPRSLNIHYLINKTSARLQVASISKLLQEAGCIHNIQELLLREPAFTYCRHTKKVHLEVGYVMAQAANSRLPAPAAAQPMAELVQPPAQLLQPPAASPMGVGAGLSAAPAFAPGSAPPAAGVRQPRGMGQPPIAWQEDRAPYVSQVKVRVCWHVAVLGFLHPAHACTSCTVRAPSSLQS